MTETLLAITREKGCTCFIMETLNMGPVLVMQLAWKDRATTLEFCPHESTVKIAAAADIPADLAAEALGLSGGLFEKVAGLVADEYLGDGGTGSDLLDQAIETDICKPLREAARRVHEAEAGKVGGEA